MAIDKKYTRNLGPKFESSEAYKKVASDVQIKKDKAHKKTVHKNPLKSQSNIKDFQSDLSGQVCFVCNESFCEDSNRKFVGGHQTHTACLENFLTLQLTNFEDTRIGTPEPKQCIFCGQGSLTAEFISNTVIKDGKKNYLISFHGECLKDAIFLT